MIQFLSFGLLYYLRYFNQNLVLTFYENKTGNLISGVFFAAIVLVIIINLFVCSRRSRGAYLFLFTISLIALLSLAISGIITQKDIKLILASVFLSVTLFILSSFIIILFSKNFSLVKSFLFCIIIFIFCLTATFFSVLNFSDDSQFYSAGRNKADIGVILGAAVWSGNRPSPVLKERIKKGFEIYSKGIVPMLVITGGAAPNEMTEAEVSKNELIKLGMDTAKLIVENTSSSTIEQMRYIRDNLYKTKNYTKVILISDNFHLLRAKEIGRFNNIEMGCIASDKEMTTEGAVSFCLKESLALIIFWMIGL